MRARTTRRRNIDPSSQVVVEVLVDGAKYLVLEYGAVVNCDFAIQEGLVFR